MDDKILNILRELKEGQKGIEDKLDRLEGKVDTLEFGQREIKKQLNSKHISLQK